MAGRGDRRPSAKRLLHGPSPGMDLASPPLHISLPLSLSLADCSGRRLGEGYQQLEGRAQILGPDALRASDLQALPAQVLRTL